MVVIGTICDAMVSDRIGVSTHLVGLVFGVLPTLPAASDE